MYLVGKLCEVGDGCPLLHVVYFFIGAGTVSLKPVHSIEQNFKEIFNAST
jgi:hypothetical protein